MSEIIDLIENPTATPQAGDYVRVREGAGVVVKQYFPPADNSGEIALLNFRAERDRLFAETQWIRQRHSDRVDMDMADGANWALWLDYWQTLRDMPNAEGFDAKNPQWPDRPE